ncbi:unnamed protein product [Meloidogyne enterolobii]|uniref:Uncharacterized protein n=1 Tax=Meloidogyne enterolobii TaxID=390850 RepID=A0ACB1ADL2_MELEN
MKIQKFILILIALLLLERKTIGEENRANEHEKREIETVENLIEKFKNLVNVEEYKHTVNVIEDFRKYYEGNRKEDNAEREIVENQLSFLLKELPKDEENAGEKEVREKQVGEKQVGKTDEQVGKQAVDLSIKTWDEQTINKLKEKSKQNMDVFIDYINKLVCGKEKLEELNNKAREIKTIMEANKHNNYVYKASRDYSLQIIGRLYAFRKETDSILIKIVLLKKGYPTNYFNFGEFLEGTNKKFKELVKIGDGKHYLIKKEFDNLKEGIIKSIEGTKGKRKKFIKCQKIIKERSEWFDKQGELRYINYYIDSKKSFVKLLNKLESAKKLLKIKRKEEEKLLKSKRKEEEKLAENKLEEMKKETISGIPPIVKTIINKAEIIEQVLIEGKLLERELEALKKFSKEMTKVDFINKLEAIQTSLENKKENKHVGENLETIQISLSLENKQENKLVGEETIQTNVGEDIETIQTNVGEDFETSKTNVWENYETTIKTNVWEALKTIKKTVWEKLEKIKTSLAKKQEGNFKKNKQSKLINKLKTIQKDARIENFKTCLEMLESTKTMFYINEMKQELLKRIPKLEECFKNKKKKSFEQVLNELKLAKTSLLNLNGQTEVLNKLENIKQVLEKKESKNKKEEKDKVLRMFREVTNKFEKNKDYDKFVVNSINNTKEMLEEGTPYVDVLDKLEITIGYLTNCTTRINLLNELGLTKQSFMEKESDEKLFKHLERMETILSKNISLETLEKMKRKLEVEGDIVTKENLIDEELLDKMYQKVGHIQNNINVKPGDLNEIEECKKWEMPESKEKNAEFTKKVEAYRFNLVNRFVLLENLTMPKIVKNSKSIVETIKENQKVGENIKEEGENIGDNKKKDMLNKLKNKNKELRTNLMRLEKYLNESEIVIINFIENNAEVRI